MLRLLELIPGFGTFVAKPVLDGAHIAVDATQGGVNLIVDGVQLVVIRGALNAAQFVLGI